MSVNPEHCQTVIKQSRNHKHDLFRLGSWNVGALRGRAGEIVKTLKRRERLTFFVYKYDGEEHQ